MKTSSAVSSLSSKPTVLLIDKRGMLGRVLLPVLSDQQVVFVTQAVGSREVKGVTFVPFKNKIPQIPDLRYATILVVREGSELDVFLPMVLRKAENDRTRFVLITNIRQYDPQLTGEMISSAAQSCAIIYGDIFTDKLPPDVSPVNVLLDEAISSGCIVVPNDGMEKIFPVLLDDVVSGVGSIVNAKELPGKTVSLCPPPMTYLTLTRNLQKINPELRVDFVRTKNADQIVEDLSKKNAISLLSREYSLKEKLQKMGTLQSMNMTRILRRPRPATRKSNGGGAWSACVPKIGMFLVSLAILPGLLVVICSLLGVLLLGNAKNNLEKGNMDNARQSVWVSKVLLKTATQAANYLTWEASVVGMGERTSILTSKVAMVYDIADASGVGLDGGGQLTSVLLGKSNDPRKDFQSGLNGLRYTLVTLQKTQASSDPGNKLVSGQGFLFNIFDKKANAVLSPAISRIQKLFHFTGDVIDIAPSLVGLEKKQTYLVLFQNNMELRPGGGFIGSYGLLTFDKGRLAGFTIHDVYDADGQLRGHIEPPFALRRYLPSIHWYLRDSNFDLDFAKGASMSAFLLNQETGQVVDGVIGVDMTLMKDLLKATGPVYMPDYKETVTSDNVYEKTQAHVDKDFFPGSSQKKDFLRSLFTAIQDHIAAKKQLSYVALAEMINDAMAQKHILFALSDQSLQNVFTVNGLSSSLWDSRQPDGQVNDFLGINEANVGVNKANFFIKRSVMDEVMIGSDGTINEKATVTYVNSGVSWPGGDYKNYLRVITPLGTTLSSVSIDGQEQKIVQAVINPLSYEAKQFATPQGLEVNQEVYQGKTIFGFLVIVPAGTTKTVSISYTLPYQKATALPSFTYAQRLFKQPGTDNDTYSFFLTYPQTYTILQVPNGFQKKEDRAGHEVSLLEDTDILLELTRQ